MSRTIQRREFLVAVGAAAILPACGRAKFSTDMINQVSSDLPFEVFSAPGEHAIGAWEELSVRYSGSASPVVLGPREELEFLGDSWVMDSFGSPESILTKASSINFPSGFRAHLEQQMQALIDRSKNGPEWQSLLEDSGEIGLAEDLPTGEWPNEPVNQSNELGLSVATNWETGRAHDEVLIGLFPTVDWTEIPAYMPFGGWNACPFPEWHVAALRHWRDDRGAQLIGLGHDTMNLRVKTRPESRDEALRVAREQYDYCSDIVEQGVGSIAALAHELMASDWWYFWWD